MNKRVSHVYSSSRVASSEIGRGKVSERRVIISSGEALRLMQPPRNRGSCSGKSRVNLR